MGQFIFCVKNPATVLIDTACAVKIFRILEHRRSLKIIHLAGSLALQGIGVVKIDKNGLKSWVEKKKLRLCEIFLQKRQIKRDRTWVIKIEKK